MIYTIRFFFNGVPGFQEIEITANSHTEAYTVAEREAKAASASHFNVSIGRADNV